MKARYDPDLARRTMTLAQFNRATAIAAANAALSADCYVRDGRTGSCAPPVKTRLQTDAALRDRTEARWLPVVFASRTASVRRRSKPKADASPNP